VWPAVAATSMRFPAALFDVHLLHGYESRSRYERSQLSEIAVEVHRLVAKERLVRLRLDSGLCGEALFLTSPRDVLPRSSWFRHLEGHRELMFG
jgi:hypothetical protein